VSLVSLEVGWQRQVLTGGSAYTGAHRWHCGPSSG
jgi:hypothetical protein